MDKKDKKAPNSVLELQEQREHLYSKIRKFHDIQRHRMPTRDDGDNYGYVLKWIPSTRVWITTHWSNVNRTHSGMNDLWQRLPHPPVYGTDHE